MILHSSFEGGLLKTSESIYGAADSTVGSYCSVCGEPLHEGTLVYYLLKKCWTTACEVKRPQRFIDLPRHILCPELKQQETTQARPVFCSRNCANKVVDFYNHHTHDEYLKEGKYTLSLAHGKVVDLEEEEA